MPRELTEEQFNAARDKALGAAPQGMTEEQFTRWWQRQGQSVMDGAIAEAEELAKRQPEGTALERIGGALKAVPAGIFQMAHGIVNPAVGAMNAEAMVSASEDQAGKAKAAFQEGRYPEALGHAVGTVPIIGTPLAQTGEQIASGDLAGGLTNAVLLAGGPLIPGAARAVRGRVNPAALEAGAASRVADVMSPKVGANKTRFGNMGEKVAPQIADELAAEGAPLSRQTFHAEQRAKLAEAEAGLDAASDARLKASTFDTKPLIDALLEKRRALTSEAVEGSRIIPAIEEVGGPRPRQLSKTARPIGEDVVASPNAARVAVIDRAIAELRQLGPVTKYDPIRIMRQAYDGPAKAVYSPAVTADYMKAQGGKLGAADVTGVLRENLAQWDPQTATANAEYSLRRTVTDVLDATAEVERTRPRLGRALMARLTGTLLGSQAGPAGAVAGFVGGPILDQAMASGMTTQLKTAAVMQRLASAIRSGNTQAITQAETALQALKGELAAGATTTGDSRTRPTRATGAGPLGQGPPQLVAP